MKISTIDKEFLDRPCDIFNCNWLLVLGRCSGDPLKKNMNTGNFDASSNGVTPYQHLFHRSLLRT